MADDSEILDRLREALSKGSDEIEDLIKDLPRLNKEIDNWKKELEATRPASKAFKDFLLGTKQPLADMTNEFKKLDRAIEQAVKANEDKIAADLETQRSQLATAYRQKNVNTAMANFAIGMGQVTKTILSGAYEFVKDLQGTKEGTEILGSAAEKAATATGQLVENFGAVASALGPLMVFLKKLPWVGLALTGLGIAAEVAGPALSDMAKKGLQVLNTEVDKTKKGFRDITGVGAEFAGGMSEMRNEAYRAGLDITQFAAIIKSSTESLSMMGVGLTEASRRIAGVSGVLRNSSLGQDLRNLGLNVEEQGEMAALTASMLNASGRLRSMTDREVAEATVAYTKDLKVLQGLTGEDARKKLEQARKDALQADILAEAMRVGGPEAVERTIAALNAVPEYARTGVMELMSTQGRAIGDFATNLNMARNPKLRGAIYGFYNDITDASLSASDISQRTLRNFEEVGEYARSMPGNFKEIGTAVRMGATELAPAFDMYNQQIMYGVKVAKGTSDAVRNEVEGAAGTIDPLTTTINQLDEEVQRLKAALGKELTGPIIGYNRALLKSTHYVDQFADVLKSVKDAMADDFGVKNPEDKGISWGKMLLGGAMVAGGAALTAATGGWGGLLGGGFVAGTGASMMSDAYQGKAKGGISTGPVSGYQETLHGTEAVVPLPDDKSIPVTITKDADARPQTNMDMARISADINGQSVLLTEILRTLKDGNNIQSGILQNSY